MTLEQRQQRDSALFSPINCFQHSHKIKTVSDAIKLPSRSLGSLMRDYGKEWVIGYITLWLIDLNDTSNVKSKMNDAQIEFTAIRIYDNYSLKITDLTLFFRNVKEGVYGEFYENLSSEKILGWLAKYYDLRCEYAEMISNEKHAAFDPRKDKMNMEVHDVMFEGVGDTIVNHETKGSGMGSRFKNRLKQKGVVVSEEDYLEKMFKEILKTDTESLKNYLLSEDATSSSYEAKVYDMVEKELDRRNEAKNKSA